MKARSTIAIAILLAATAATADELRLKDGTKIEGTIVGFEDNTFKVQTNFGFALVRKDQVISIVVSGADKKAAAEKKQSTASDAEKKPLKEPEKVAANEHKSEPSPPVKKPAPTPALAPKVEVSAKPLAEATRPVVAPTPTAAAGAAATSALAPAKSAATPALAAPPAPAPMREHVEGNTYANETYGFHMYKPPDWELIEGARTILPGTITALGTSDGNTYLLIGQEPLGRSVDTHVPETEARLRDVLDNYRPLGERHIQVADAPAIERKFRGSVDDREWSGVVVLVPHGDRVFTIFGMTYADSDLVQIQENIIRRTIASLTFSK